MKKRIQWPLLFIILLIAVDAHTKTASEVFESVSASVVVIKTYDVSGKAMALGSGVVLPSGVVATNFHVIEGATLLKVFHQQVNYTAAILHSDRDHDVCTLTVSGLKAPSIILGNTSRLKVGSRVYAIGAPKGLELTFSEGIISSMRPADGGQYLQITAPISPGSSGGGLFDEEGRLIGLTTFYIAEGQQLNFAVPVEWVGELPERNKLRFNNAETYSEWLKKSSSLEKKKDWVELRSHSLKRIELFPKDAMAWYCLGIAYDNYGQVTKAIEAYQQSLLINPEYAWAWNNLCGTLLSSGQTSKAMEACNQSLRIDPENAKAWSNLGFVYSKLDQHTRAIDAYQQGLRLDPEDAILWNNLGSSYVKSGQAAKAIEAYHQALRINPEYVNAWYNLGAMYADSGQTAKVTEIYKRLKILSPTIADEFFRKVVLPQL